VLIQILSWCGHHQVTQMYGITLRCSPDSRDPA
jgi:hypothetical protein